MPACRLVGCPGVVVLRLLGELGFLGAENPGDGVLAVYGVLPPCEAVDEAARLLLVPSPPVLERAAALGARLALDAATGTRVPCHACHSGEPGEPGWFCPAGFQLETQDEELPDEADLFFANGLEFSGFFCFFFSGGTAELSDSSRSETVVDGFVEPFRGE